VCFVKSLQVLRCFLSWVSTKATARCDCSWNLCPHLHHVCRQPLPPVGVKVTQAGSHARDRHTYSSSSRDTKHRHWNTAKALSYDHPTPPPGFKTTHKQLPVKLLHQAPPVKDQSTSLLDYPSTTHPEHPNSPPPHLC
jgi:hypothetical protein